MLRNNASQKLEIWPQVLIDAKSNGVSDAARLWFLAKRFDVDGLGKIPLDGFWKSCKALGLRRRSFTNWYRQARDLGLFKQINRGEKGTWAVMPAWEKGFAILGCFNPGKRKAHIDAAAIIGRDWFAYVWAAALSTYGAMISREKLRELTGVPERTQYRLEQKAGVESMANYCKSKLDLGRLTGIKDYKQPHAFNGHNGIMWRLPDTRYTDQHRGRVGRSKKIAAELSGSFLTQSSFISKRALSEFRRTFFKTKEKAEKHLRKLGREDYPLWRIGEVYYRQGTQWQCL